MAVIHFNNGEKKIITREQGKVIWEVLNGDVEPTAEQEEYCLRIKNFYMGWRNAPDSYIEANKDVIFPMAIREWMVSRDGIPSRPEDSKSWTFAKRWGLWYQGSKTELADRIIKGNGIIVKGTI